MGRVVEVRVPPGCLKSAPVREYDLSEPVDERLMRSLAEGGRLQYFPSFPRPFFRIERPLAFTAQGIVGSPTLRVTFSPSAGPDVRETLLCSLGGTEAIEANERS